MNPAVVPPARPQVRPLLIFGLSIAALYFARQIFIPLALALLFTFLIAPVVRRLEIWGVGRVGSVIIAMILSSGICSVLGWVVANQMVDVVGRIPDYASNIHRKMEYIHGPRGGTLAKFVEGFQELSTDLSSIDVRREGAEKSKQRTEPMRVQVVQPPSGPVQAVKDFAGPFLGVLAGVGIVTVFTIFMLLEREQLRNRLFLLAGVSQIHAMTNALDDAAQRVSRYLSMQGLVNAVFGIVVGTGLYFIGVPNALLWAVLAALLRFLPYLGPILAGSFPLMLAMAVFDGWRMPILTAALFIVTELIVGNVVEPWLYGAHTGISSLAILVAAVFWTMLWGLPGLVLSTPLTVCLVVLGRHVPQLEFLNVLLGDEPQMSPEAHYYQRLLAMDQIEAHAILESLANTKPLVEVYDQTIVPALSMTEQERHSGALSETREEFIVNSVNESVLQLGSAQPTRENGHEQVGKAEIGNAFRPRVLCVPAKDAADEITAAMMAQLLEQAGFLALAFPLTENVTEVFREISTEARDVIFISSLPPFAILQAQKLNKLLRSHFPKTRTIIGLWTPSQASEGSNERITKAFDGAPVVTSFAQGIAEVAAIRDGEMER